MPRSTSSFFEGVVARFQGSGAAHRIRILARERERMFGLFVAPGVEKQLPHITRRRDTSVHTAGVPSWAQWFGLIVAVRITWQVTVREAEPGYEDASHRHDCLPRGPTRNRICIR
ncbi:hypothetical protein LshimejAT787_0800250 [Lyophyllum shimeji]|uniref:Uncharacterized protein n=1 Tax=Lyophyllum shimeji TaxID=47721 RepID=A0A9P3PRD7_LYOSH|nr:hypothetical protein LshimejAT787_0800250 [Lyophyllum shimeji]